MQTEAIFQAEVSSVVKGGLLVDIGYDVRAFLPGSQVDIGWVSDFSVYVGRTIPVQVIEVDPRTADIVVSRRRVLEEERRQRARRRPPEPKGRGRHAGASGRSGRPAAPRGRSLDGDGGPDGAVADEAEHDWRSTTVRAGAGRLVIDVSTADDIDEVREIVSRRVEVEAARGVSEILVRMQPGQKRELRALVASGAIETVDSRRSHQVQDGLVLVLVRREQEDRPHA